MIRTPNNKSLIAALAVVALLPAPVQASLDDERVGFNRDIRPLLVKNCFACHGDAKTVQGNVMMKSFEDVVGDNGFEAIVIPGDADNSPMFKRISSPHPEMRMPPEETDKQLSASEIATVRQWINEGAQWQRHWSYVRPLRPAVPEVVRTDWVRNPIDAFILKKLEAAGLQPSASASGTVLARRLHLDLNGLLPDYAEIEAKNNIELDNDAYMAAVDQLLASPHFGERMAVPWLDWVKYSDEISGSLLSPFYLYRNYVIDAFNKNTAFDQFTIEQLAGDLLPNPSDEQMIASGYNHLIVRIQDGVGFEAIHKYVTERVDKLAQVWLASSFECAQCHDHKFDPILQKDYYQLGAFFNDLDRVGVWHTGVSGDSTEPRNPDSYFRWPQHYVPSAEQQQRLDAIEAELEQLYQQLQVRREAVDEEAIVDAIRADAAQSPDYFTWIDPLVESASVMNTNGETPLRVEKQRTAGGNRAIVMREINYVFADEITAEQRGREYHNTVVLEHDTVRAVQVKFTTRGERRSDFRNISLDERAGAPLRLAEVEFWLTPISGDGERIPLPVATVEATDLSMQPTDHLVDGDPSTLYSLNATDIFDTYRLDREDDLFLKGINNEAFFTFVLAQPIDNATQYKLEVLIKHADADSAAYQYNIAYTAHAAAGPMLNLTELPVQSSSVMRSFKQWLYEFLNENIVRTEFMDFTAQKLFSSYALSVGISSPVPFNDVMKSTVSTLKENLALEQLYIDQFLLRHQTFRDIGMQVRDLKRERDKLWGEVDRSWASIPSQSRWTTRVLLKGEPTDTTGPLADRLLPGFLSENNGRNSEGEELSRLDLAQWVVSDDNPLTARVIVNRLWQLFMGRGIVHTVEDFGSGGHRGTHPELLDWLATEFIISGWDTKHMVRLMVSSNTYRQGSTMSSQLRQVDPENQLYARQNVRQIEAEFIQDNALRMAGLLQPGLGGKHTVHGARDNPYIEDQYRRSIYLVRRNDYVQPQLKVFGAKPRVGPVIERPESITPLQALAGLNQPLMFRVAQVLATQVADNKQLDADAKLRLVYRKVLGREPSTQELDFSRSARAEFTRTRSGDENEDSEHAFWLSQVRTIMNLRETVVRV